MSVMTDPVQAEMRDCADPECLEENGPRMAEPEQDGDHSYYICTVCGYEFGWGKVQSQTMAVEQDGSCQVGIPETIRRSASAGMENAMASAAREEARTKPVDLGLKIGRRPGL